MKTTLTLLNVTGRNVFANKTTRAKRALLVDFETALYKLLDSGMRGRGDVGSVARLPSYVGGQAAANGVITPTGVLAADTATLNGQALTATQARASGTVTAASVLAADTVTVNGVVFTAVTGAAAANQFDRSGADAVTAANLAAAINASTSAGVADIAAVVKSGAVVTIFAKTEGAGGNAYTLVSSNGGRLAVSGATLASGAAVANNQFDFAGSDTYTARSLVNAINNSTTAIVKNIKASNRSATITLASVAEGETVTIGNYTFMARGGGSNLSLTEFDISGTDTQDAAALVSAINNHPELSTIVWADSAAGVVTVRERPIQTPPATTTNFLLPLLKSGAHFTLSGNQITESAAVLLESVVVGAVGNCQTIASSNGTRLPILGSATRLLNGADITNSF